ncbi:hypothetical protein QL285_051687 [Trifolium repens]|nr:hypothetical protein QL285_051687 [Trifolium repens]
MYPTHLRPFASHPPKSTLPLLLRRHLEFLQSLSTNTTRKIEYRGSHIEALGIQPPPLILLPTVTAAFSNRRRSQAITDMHSEAFTGVSAAVHFPSLLFSVTNSLITIASLHHHRNPLFSTKNGQNQFQVLSISPSHHLINPFNFTCFQFQVIFVETLIDSKDEFLQKYLVVYDFVRHENFTVAALLEERR